MDGLGKEQKKSLNFRRDFLTWTPMVIGGIRTDDLPALAGLYDSYRDC